MRQLATVDSPTPYPEVNALVKTLLENLQAVLQGHFIGLYLDGSLANGGFDEDSDIDFVVVTDEEISKSQFADLHCMHERIAGMDSPFAIQLEGSYLSRQALRRYDPALSRHPNIERGPGEQLKWAEHGEAWNVHRWVLRERGIRVTGPDPLSLVDPVQPGQLQQAMRSLLSGWVKGVVDDPAQIQQRGYQSYIVLSLCRILYTLEQGSVAPKNEAASWARKSLDGCWGGLIERAWEGRHHSGGPASPREVQETLDFAHYAIERERQ